MNDASKETMRQRILIGIALSILGIYAFVSFTGARSAADRLSQVQDDLQELERKLSEIERLSEAPKIAALETEEPGAIINRITDAIEKAGLPKDSVLNQPTLDPTPIQGTDFSERKTTIKLEKSSLAKIVRFCDALRDEQTGSVVTQLSLTSPKSGRNNAGGEDWEVNLTLTQTIYSPKSR